MIKHISSKLDIEEASKLTQEEIDFIDTIGQNIFTEAGEKELRPYVLIALCGSIASNVVRQSDGALDADAIMQWLDMATRSQLE